MVNSTRAGIISILFTTVILAIASVLCTKIESIAFEKGVRGGPRMRALVVGIRREGRLESLF